MYETNCQTMEVKHYETAKLQKVSPKALFNISFCAGSLASSTTDKTMCLLKEGAKSLALNVSDDDLQLEYSDSYEHCVKTEPIAKLKQTFLSNNLQLQTSGAEIRHIAIALCGCCRIINSDSKCNRCDQILCTSCLIGCAGCSGTFCQNCLLQVYDCGEKSLCLDCYR